LLGQCDAGFAGCALHPPCIRQAGREQVPGGNSYLRSRKNGRTQMRRTNIAVSGALAMFGLAMLVSAAFADQSFTGTISILDRTTNEIVLKPAPAGETTGANAGGLQSFKMRGAIPDTLHAGDKVTVSYTEAGGVRTISSVAPPQ
jgi:hypothetical protein